MQLFRRFNYTVFLCCFSLLALSSEAQTAYTDISPDVKIEGWEVYQLSMDQSAGLTMEIWLHPGEVVIRTLDDGFQVLVDAQNHPLALENGAAIGSSGTWVKPDYYMMWNGTSGNWQNAVDKYLGLRFMKNGVWHYGWARLDVDAAPTYFIIKDYAYNSSADAAINAGEGGFASIQAVKSNEPYINAVSKIGKGELTVYVNGFTEGDLTVADGQGKQIYWDKIQSGMPPKTFSSLKPGMYVVQAYCRNKIIAKQVVVW
jgi:hypothetical protein